MTDQPTLTDGVVALRPWQEADTGAALTGRDELIEHWLGPRGAPATPEEHQAAVERWTAGWLDGSWIGFVIEHAGEVVGSCEVHRTDERTGDLRWVLYAGHRGQGHATRAVRTLADWALTETGQGGLGLSRVEAHVEPGNQASIRVATRAGLRREGIRRVPAGTGERTETTELIVLARLADDPPISEPGAFRALLNSFLPRKRAISQMLIRDEADRVLLCELTYKQDWDLPGGVVEVGESPQLAVSREVEEELGLQVAAGLLLLTDWLPPWGGWDDALCLVFDGGRHPADLVERIVCQPREIRSARFCTPAEVEERSADFTARRVAAALAQLGRTGPSGGGAGYTESGR